MMLFTSCPLPPKPGLENDCGTVFPAGVGPDSPSRDAANWLSRRDSLSALQNTQALRDVLAVKKRDLGRYGA